MKRSTSRPTHISYNWPSTYCNMIRYKVRTKHQTIVFGAFSFLGFPAAIIEYNGHNLSTRLPGRRTESDIFLSFSGKRKEERGRDPPLSPPLLYLSSYHFYSLPFSPLLSLSSPFPPPSLLSPLTT